MSEGSFTPGQLCHFAFAAWTARGDGCDSGWENFLGKNGDYCSGSTLHRIYTDDVLLYLRKFNNIWSEVLLGDKKVAVVSKYLEAL